MTITEPPTNWKSACAEVAEVTDLLFTRTNEVYDLGRLQEALYKLVRACVAATLCDGTVKCSYGRDISRGVVTIFEDQSGPQDLEAELVEQRTAAILVDLKPLNDELLDECRVPLGRVGQSRFHGKRAELFFKFVADAVERTQVGQPDSCPGWKYVAEMAGRVESLTFRILNENVTELHLLSHNNLKSQGWRNPVEARSLKQQKINRRRAYREANGLTEDQYPDEREHPYLK